MSGVLERMASALSAGCLRSSRSSGRSTRRLPGARASRRPQGCRAGLDRVSEPPPAAPPRPQAETPATGVEVPATRALRPPQPRISSQRSPRGGLNRPRRPRSANRRRGRGSSAAPRPTPPSRQPEPLEQVALTLPESPMREADVSPTAKETDLPPAAGASPEPMRISPAPTPPLAPPHASGALPSRLTRGKETRDSHFDRKHRTARRASRSQAGHTLAVSSPRQPAGFLEPQTGGARDERLLGCRRRDRGPQALLNTGLSEGGPATVLVSPPGITNKAPDLIQTGQDEAPQLNLFMYYASINPALRNLNQPSVDSSGNPISNPPLAINLHYLVTAYGANQYDPEILLAFAMQVFHRTPVVPASVIQSALHRPELRCLAEQRAEVDRVQHAGQPDRTHPHHPRGIDHRRDLPALDRFPGQLPAHDVVSGVGRGDPGYAEFSVEPAGPVAVADCVAANRARDCVGFAATDCGRPDADHKRADFVNGPPSNTQVAFNEGATIARATVQGNLVRSSCPAPSRPACAMWR